MTDDNLVRTIAALREQYSRWPADNHSWTSAIHLRVADLLALCYAAEAGLLCPPREPDRMMTAAGINALRVTGGDVVDDVRATWRAMYDAAQINEGGQERSTGDNPERNVPVPPSPDVALVERMNAAVAVICDAAEAENAKLRAALAELVACEDLKEQADYNLLYAQTTGSLEDGKQIIEDYRLRKPLAWQAARAALEDTREPTLCPQNQFSTAGEPALQERCHDDESNGGHARRMAREGDGDHVQPGRGNGPQGCDSSGGHDA